MKMKIHTTCERLRLGRYFIIFTTAVLALAAGSEIASAKTDRSHKHPVRILVVDSYYPKCVLSEKIRDGFMDSISSAFPEAISETLYLQEIKGTTPTELLENQKETWITVATRPWDMVLLIDPGALRSWRTLGYKAFAGVPATYCGVRPKDASTDWDKRVVQAGIINRVETRIDAAATFRAARKLFPELRHLVVISGHSPFGHAVRTAVYEQIEEDMDVMANLSVHFISGDEYTAAQMLSKVKNLPANTCVLMSPWTADMEGAGYDAIDISRRVCLESGVPVMTTSQSLFGTGVLGGKVVNNRAQGRLAGDISVVSLTKAINYEPLSTISMPQYDINHIVFDSVAMGAWGIDRVNLPKGSEIDNANGQALMGHPVVWGTLSLVSLIFVAGACLAYMLGSHRGHNITNSKIPSGVKIEDILENSPVGIATFSCKVPRGKKSSRDAELTLVNCNKAFKDILGISCAFRSEIQTEDVYDCLTTKIRDYLIIASENHSSIKLSEYETTFKNFLELNCFSPRPGICCLTAVDVTEGRRVVYELQETERQLRLTLDTLEKAQDVAMLGYWLFNPQTHEVIRTEHIKQMFGMDPNIYRKKDFPPPFYDRIHPDDLAFVRQTRSECIDQDKPIDLIYRINLPETGSIRYVREQSNIPMAAASDSALRFGVVQDVTSALDLQFESRRRLRLLENLASRSAQGTAIVDVNDDNTIVVWNQRMVELTGIEASEAINSSLPELLPELRHITADNLDASCFTCNGRDIKAVFVENINTIDEPLRQYVFEDITDDVPLGV